ncbi:hypothetical protein [Pseudoxanthomonas beigongshangi]
MKADNSAERLLTLLVEGKRKEEGMACRRAWGELLGVSKTDSVLLTSQIGKVMMLPSQIVRDLQDSSPNGGNTWSHWAGQVSLAFARQNLDAAWKTFIEHIDEHTLTYLRLSADILSTRKNIATIDIEAINETRKKVSDCLDEVLTSGIDQSVKAQIVRHLRAIIDALDNYQIFGAQPILDAVEVVAGHTHFDEKYFSFLKDSDLGARIHEALTAAANLVTVAVGVPQLAQAALLIAHSV